MLDCAVSSLLKFFPAASHAVILLRDRGSNCLLLQAHVPAGEPSASMELAEHVLQQKLRGDLESGRGGGERHWGAQLDRDADDLRDVCAAFVAERAFGRAVC